MRLTTMICAVGAFVAFSSVSSVHAADMPRAVYKAPAYLSPVPTFSWSGLYLGVHGGYGWTRWTGTGALGTDSVNGNGWLAGGQIGYNYQTGRFVLGIEGDYSWANVKHETALFAGNLTLKNDYFATVTGRVGYAFDNILVYGKGGVAWTRDKWDATDGLGGTATGDFNRQGWVIGAGVEYAFWGNVSAKIEYNYLWFKSISETLTTTGGLVVAGTPDVKQQTHLVKVGLNYRFNLF